MKHKLDTEVEELLQHFGIKGMKWNIRRSDEQIKEDLENGVNAAGEALEDAGDEVFGNDSITEELGDVLDIVLGGKGNLKKETAQLKDAIKDKAEDVAKDVKERGSRILTRMFGKSKSSKKSLVRTKDGYKWKNLD